MIGLLMHRYKVRPGYGSTKLLIEFEPDGSDTLFWDDLVAIFKRNDVEFLETSDLVFMIVSRFRCAVGEFEIDHDEWGFFWGHDEEQEAIGFLDRILSESDRFQRQAVDPGAYTLPDPKDA